MANASKTTNNINESIHLVDEENKNVFYTKEVYDLKNYIVNNVDKDVIKICDYVSQGLYVFCNAYNGIHEMLEEMAQEQGLVDSSNDVRYVAYTGTTEDDDYETIDYSDGIVYDYGDFKIFEVTQALGKSKFIGSRLQRALGQFKSKYRLVNGSFRRIESLNEFFDRLDKYDGADVYATDSAYQLKNTIEKSEIPLRIYLWRDTYYFCSAVGDMTHDGMMQFTSDEGYSDWSESLFKYKDYMVFLPNNTVDFYDTTLGEDDYFDCRVYPFGVMYVRDTNAYSNSLFKALGEPLREVHYNESRDTVKISTKDKVYNFDADSIGGPWSALSMQLEDLNESKELLKTDSSKELLKACGKFVYHATDKKHLKQIFKEGLHDFWFGCDANDCEEYVTMNHDDYNDLCIIEISTKQLNPNECDFTEDVGDGWSDVWTGTGVYYGTIKKFHNIYNLDASGTEMSDEELSKWIDENNIVFEQLDEDTDLNESKSIKKFTSDDIVNFLLDRKNKNSGIQVYADNEPGEGSNYILPDGRFLHFGKMKIHSQLLSVIYNELLNSSNNYPDVVDDRKTYYVMDYLEEQLGWIRCNTGRADITYEYYIALDRNMPTNAQYNAILKFLDYLQSKGIKSVEVNRMDVHSRKTYSFSDYISEDIVKKIKQSYSIGKLRESLLLEKNRQDLLNKSRASDNYSSKDRQGENRYTRRLKSQIANSVRDYNRIDMDAFWKGDILDFDVRVHGETDDYVVSLDFSNILRRIQQEVSSNKNRLEFKCVLRALVGAFNSDSDLLVSCTCPDWKYRQAYWATRGGYNSGQPQPSNGMAIANPNDTKGAGCKHVNLVLSNLDWMMKIASVINNYIKWTRDNMARNYADYIFPKVYGMPYKKAVQLSLLDKEDKFGDAILPSDIDTINQAIERGMIGKDDQGKFVKGNEYRFQKTTKHQPEDNPDQMKLDLDNEEEDKEVNKSVADIEKEKNVRFTKDEPQEPEEDKEANIRFEK